MVSAFQPEVHRIAGEIPLLSPERDAAKAEAYFDRALTIARQQPAKSWELRAAMSLARLWRDQHKDTRCSKRANCWLRCTGGLRKGLTRAI
jgi:predicted ATPase